MTTSARPSKPRSVKVVPGDFWRQGLLITTRGEPKRGLANVMHVLSMHPDWSGVLAWDEFGVAVVTRRRPPMRSQDVPDDYTIGDWADEDSARTVAWFASEVGFEPATSHVDQAVAAVARKTVVHPVRDWLASLQWDGTPRLDTFAASYLGARESEYSRAVCRKWLISAVARVFKPGCKVDSLLGLEGDQGIGKSSALRLLAGPAWFADTGIAIGDKDSYQALRRKWIFEFAELASIRGREIERVKNFLSSQVDTYRASYGRRTQDHPRQCVFAGSTNEAHYLADPTGSRRFWPLRCSTVDLDAIRRDRDQLWAEARTAYESGEPWHLDTPELRALAAAEQEDREERDDWVDIVARWLEAPTRPDGRGGRDLIQLDDGITTADVLLGAIGVPAERITPGATKRIGHVLRALGLEPRRIRVPGQWERRERRYYRGTRDATWDAPPAENTCTSHVPRENVRTYTRVHQEEDRCTHRFAGISGGTPGTLDADDVERDAVVNEGCASRGAE